MTAPIFITAASYPDQQAFLTYFWAYAAHAYVVSTPGLFMMFRAIRHDMTFDEVRDVTTPVADPDCWLIWEAAGRLPTLLAVLPLPFPFIAFYRRKDPQLRVYPTERFTRLAQRPVPAPTPTNHI